MNPIIRELAEAGIQAEYVSTECPDVEDDEIVFPAYPHLHIQVGRDYWVIWEGEATGTFQVTDCGSVDEVVACTKAALNAWRKAHG